MPDPELRRLGAEFFALRHGSDPFNATMLGVAGFDDQVPDPSRDAAADTARRLAAVERAAAALDPAALDDDDRVDRAVLIGLSEGVRSDLEHGSWEANASADGYGNPQGTAFLAVPTVSLPDAPAVEGYLRRLDALGGFFDALDTRYRQAAADGRRPTAVGVAQAVDQLRGHLGRPADADVFQRPALPGDVDAARVRARIAEVTGTRVRPAMARLAALLDDELRPTARTDAEVGLASVPGGEAAYSAAVRRQTTTDLTPGQVHEIGLAVLEDLKDEWRELGGRVLGTSDVAEVRDRLRTDPALRFESSGQLVDVVRGALERAEAARDDWFPAYAIADCVIEEIDPVEAGNAALAHYRPPSADGSRPGAHCVLTVDPQERFAYEYEALAFHESTPGHHLQIASAQTLTSLPEYRRFLDAEVCAYVEGWGLYSERLADEMGLYTSDLQRLGMVSFDAWRAGRLVVDTGMHALGWSREQAVEFMWSHTATTRANVVNEVNRYIAWPAQALAYMVGRREIVRLRTGAETRLGSRFDVRGFHGAVLSNGAVPLGVLADVVDRWVAAQSPPEPGAPT
ncbi:DUF885 domain-containing protein [Modestobacter sp. URMC 112]